MSDDWSSKWPKKPGVYLFYGYAINSEVEHIPRLHLVTVEYVSETFGVQYRTSRITIKKESGAYGMWQKVLAPDLPDINEERATRAARSTKIVEELQFID